MVSCLCQAADLVCAAMPGPTHTVIEFRDAKRVFHRLLCWRDLRGEDESSAALGRFVVTIFRHVSSLCDKAPTYHCQISKIVCFVRVATG